MKSEISDHTFEQLVRRTLSDVAAITPIDRTIDPSVGRQSKMRSTSLRIAAALLAVVGIGGLIVAQRETAKPPAAQYASAADPVAHLFVLPEDTDSLELSGGGAYTAQPDGPMQDLVGFLVGIERDGVFSDLVLVRGSAAIPDGFDRDGTTQIGTPTGPAIVDENDQLAQQRGDTWLLLSGSSGTQSLVDALEQITLDPAGTLRLEDGPRSIIEEFQQSTNTVGFGTSYEAIDTVSGTTFVVETATTSSVIAFGASNFTTAQPTSVNGTPAWLLTRGGNPPEGLHVAVVWRATPNRIIAISAQTEPDDVQAMAERLKEVSAEEWSTTLPEAVIEN